MAEDRPTPDPAAGGQRELDRRVEDLARQLADVVNAAGKSRQGFSPLAFAILIGLVSLPLLLLFPPLGGGLFAMAVLMGIWGLIDTFFRRAPGKPR